MKDKHTPQSVTRQLAAFFRQERRMPSYEEMMALLEVRSKSVVAYWVDRLVAAGTLEKDERGRLRLLQSAFAVPVVGAVQAGFPSPAEEELRDVVSLDAYLIGRPESTYLLEVSGDSMTGAGILPGDLVVVEKNREARTGDIVVAEVDGEWTMKTFRREGKDIFLEAANPKYPVIRPRADLRLGGVVTGVIRKYAS